MRVHLSSYHLIYGANMLHVIMLVLLPTFFVNAVHHYNVSSLSTTTHPTDWLQLLLHVYDDCDT